MKSSIFALTFALALVQISSAQESVDPSDVTLSSDSAYPTFMPSASPDPLDTDAPQPSASPVWEDPFDTDALQPSASPVWGNPTPSVQLPITSGSGAPRSVRPPRPSLTGVPHYSGSALPPYPSGSGAPQTVRPSRSVRPPRPSNSGAPPHYSGSAQLPIPSGSVRPPRPSNSSAPPHYSRSTQLPIPSGSVRPPRPSGSGVPHYSGSALPPFSSASGMPQITPSSKSRSRPHRTTFPGDFPSLTVQPSDGAYPTGL